MNLLNNQTIATFACEIIQSEFHLIGQSITANFPQGFPEAAIKVQKDFIARRDEIIQAKNKEILFSPHMCNEIVATYFACLEVDEITDIPEGMIGFSLPKTKYAKISCSNKTIDQGYSKIFTWMGENDYRQKWLNNCCPIEIFYFEDNVDEERVDILIPIL